MPLDGKQEALYATGEARTHEKLLWFTHCPHRLLHQKVSFWVAKEECKLLGGQLLLLEHTPEVVDNLGDSMVGNVETEFRIDGWSDGAWFEGDTNITLSKPPQASLEHLFEPATVTLDVEDGSLSASHRAEAHLGFICQGGDRVGLPCAEDDDEEEEKSAENEEKLCQQKDFFPATKDVAYRTISIPGTKSSQIERCKEMNGTNLATARNEREKQAFLTELPSTYV